MYVDGVKNMEDEEDARKDSGKGRKQSRVWRGTFYIKEVRMRLKKGETNEAEG